MKENVNLLSVKQVSKYLSLTERTIQRLSKQGKIKGIKLGGQWKFRREDIERYLLYGTDFSKEPIRKPDNFIERRVFSRINCSLPCFIKVLIPEKKDVYTNARILNISEGGVSLEAYNKEELSLNIKTDDLINLEFVLNESPEIRVDGRILRIQDKVIGVKFKRIDSETSQLIREYVG